MTIEGDGVAASGPAGRVGSPARRVARGVLTGLDVLQQVLGVLALLLIFVLVSWQVLQRVFLGGSFAWTGEVAKYGMVWSSFIVMAHLLRTDQHLRIDVIEQWLGERGEQIMTRVTDSVVALVCVVLAYAGWGLMTAPSLGTSPAAGIPLIMVYAIPVTGLALTALTALILAVTGREREEMPDEGHLPEGVL